MTPSWQPHRRIEELYNSILQQAMREIGGSLIGADDSIEMLRKIKAAINVPWFQNFADMAAQKMVTHVFKDTGRSWREAAKINSKGRLIYDALQKELQGPLGNLITHQIRENAQLIKNIPHDIAREMTEHIMKETMNGIRASDIAKSILIQFPRVSAAKAKLIARTETSKTSTALTQGRCELLGIQWYRWRTSEDSRVRESHRKMDKVLVPWDNAPSPEELDNEKNYGHYHAGCIWNCRCYAEPLIDLNFVQWPCKVYYNRTIVTMTRMQFERLTKQKLAV